MITLNLITKIRHVLRRTYKRFYKYVYYSVKKINGTSDVNRWANINSFHQNWNERTSLLAKYIPENSVVLEFGAGQLTLENELPKGCTYLNSDIVSRRQDTFVIDLNKELPVLPIVDIIVFSGVLEYVKNVNKILGHCTNYTGTILFSYATQKETPKLSDRRNYGWFSDLNTIDFQQFAIKNNMTLNNLGIWKKQNLFSLKVKCE